MKVKFNKQAILKNRFWILVGVTAVLTLAGTFYLQLYGNEAVAQIQKKFKGEINTAKTIKAESNLAIIDFWDKKAEEAKKSQEKVWEKAYKDQEMLFKWAPKIETRFEFHKGKFAQEIKISKLDDENDWPKDEENLLHGKFVDIKGDYCVIKTRKGTERFFRMENLTITDTEGEPNKNTVI